MSTKTDIAFTREMTNDEIGYMGVTGDISVLSQHLVDLYTEMVEVVKAGQFDPCEYHQPVLELRFVARAR